MRIIPIEIDAPPCGASLRRLPDDATHDEKPTMQSDGASRHDAAVATTTGTRRVSSVDLFAGARELEIEHNGRRYQLRITQTGKLILTA
jgi:hemin uptake protein HemP